MDWSKLSSGRFFSIGSLFFDPSQNAYFDVTKSGTPNPKYHVGLFDTVQMMGKQYTYDETDAHVYTKLNSLRCPLEKALLFLEEEERNFLINAAMRAKDAFLKFNDGQMLSCFLCIVPPGMDVKLHNHDNVKHMTFTYVVSSNQVENDSSLLLDDGKLIPFPKYSEFFWYFDSQLNHGTLRHSLNDTNTYLYFVFDGVQQQENLEQLVMYHL